MHSTEQQQALVQKLSELSTQAKIQWNSDPDDNEPYCVLGEHILNLKEGRSGNGAPIVSIVIEDRGGVEVDSFNDEDLDRGNGPSRYFDKMLTLIKTARRQASGADEALASILKRLDDL